MRQSVWHHKGVFLLQERVRVNRPAWMDAPPSEWPDSAKRFYNFCATVAERILQEEREARNVPPPTCAD